MLEGKVAIVTGAGQGLGRAEALELARAGAAVVVNDLGTTLDGRGTDSSPAEEVVAEIKAMGGQAVSHYGDITNWDQSKELIQRAIDEFGDLHILINSVGTLRDGMIFNMSEEDFDFVMRVHVKGHFCPIRHATEYWRAQSKARGGPTYGRIISTASEAFLIASPGQPNYAAAKAAITALTFSTAQACAKYGVTANVICPRARTRMTDHGPAGAFFAKPEDGFDTFAPENVSPLVAYLASPQAERVSGYLFLVFGGHVRIIGKPTTESVFENDGTWTLETLHQELGPHFEKLEPIIDGFVMPYS